MKLNLHVTGQNVTCKLSTYVTAFIYSLLLCCLATTSRKFFPVITMWKVGHWSCDLTTATSTTQI